MAVAGDIAAAARAQMPVTWATLADDSRYGDALLQRQVDLVKERLFGTVISPDLEADTYPRTVIDYAGKLVAIQVIPAGEDYWAAQAISDSSGTKNALTWADRAENLRRLRENLIRETRMMAPEIAVLLGTTLAITRIRPRLGVRIPRNAHVTANPEDFPKDFNLPEEATGPVVGNRLSVPA